jgi:YVTN family beta-propeller protein
MIAAMLNRLLPFFAAVALTFLLESDSWAVEPRLRRPVALVESSDGQRLYVANRRSGSISVVDLEARQPVAEAELGETLADLVAIDDRRLLAVDESAHQLILLRVDDESIQAAVRRKVSPFPVEAIVTQDCRRAFASSLWSRRVTEVSISPDANDIKIVREIDIPFAPRKLLFTPDGSRLLVADAFGGKLGTIDPATGKLLAVRDIPAHNIRGLSVSSDGRMLAVAHQMLNDLAHTVRNDIHWGMLLSNDLRWLPLQAALDPDAQLYAGAHMHPLGDPGRGGADPSDLAITSSGLAIVSMGGADQIALGREQDFSLRRIAVGQRPTALAVSQHEELVYVANTFGDSVSIIDLDREETIAEVSLGPQPELPIADRGELLFYDGRLSHDGWMSCHSCHTDGHTNGMLNDNFSDGSFGASKRVLSLLGVDDTSPYAWSGQAPDIKTQIGASVKFTMQRAEPPTETQVAELAAFLKILSPPPPGVDELRGTADPEAIARGKQIFREQKCGRCHAPPSYTTPQSHDVGLSDSQGNRRFNPPSLRGLSHRGPYFHDNSAASLEDVFQVHGHQLESELTGEELTSLLTFLQSL